MNIWWSSVVTAVTQYGSLISDSMSGVARAPKAAVILHTEIEPGSPRVFRAFRSARLSLVEYSRMSPYSPTPMGSRFDKVRPGVLAMGREPSRQASHLRNHGAVLSCDQGDYSPSREPAFDDFGEVPSTEEFGDVAMNWSKAFIGYAPSNNFVTSTGRSIS